MNATKQTVRCILNNCEAVLLINQNESKNHTVEVKMAEGSEKLGFTIVAMGYVE